MFFFALGSFLPLLFRCDSHVEIISISIYAICALTMFGVSSIYHRVNWVKLNKRSLWKKIDHAGIYLMIAGTFTPIAMKGLDTENATKVLITIWLVAFVGIIQSLFFAALPRVFSALIYLIAGYLIVPYLPELEVSLGVANIGFLLGGGFFYSVGAISYGFRLFNFNPKIFGYHEVFHIFVNLGAICHFLVINSLIK